MTTSENSLQNRDVWLLAGNRLHSVKAYFYYTAARCVALRGVRYTDADSVSISLATPRNATQRAAVMEISL